MQLPRQRNYLFIYLLDLYPAPSGKQATLSVQVFELGAAIQSHYLCYVGDGVEEGKRKEKISVITLCSPWLTMARGPKGKSLTEERLPNGCTLKPDNHNT